ncbi:MAG TPA: hypothetical protein VGM53_33100 [Streptosporangiaceae bacterium]
MAIVACVVPLTLLQLPNLIASELPVGTLARIAGHGSVISLVRAAGLALPVMAFVAPLAAVLARRKRAWPALLAGLVLFGAADLLGNSAHSVLLIGVDRAVHGLGAGIALPATLALGWERSPRQGRLLARWWVVVAVLSLAASVPLMRDRLAGGDWRLALQAFPWLTGAGLAATALYVALTGGVGRPGRAAVTLAERSQLSLLAMPLAGVSALAVGVSNASGRSVAVAAGAAALVLLALAMITSADPVTGGRPGRRPRLCFPLTAACAGFTLAPTAAVLANLSPLATGGPYPTLHALSLPLAAAAGAAVVGTGAAWLCGRRGSAVAARVGAHAARRKAGKSTGEQAAMSRAALRCVLAGLVCAAAGLIVAHQAGPAGPRAELAAAYALLCGGLAMALSASVAEATPAGAMAGLSLALGGALTGYLVAGAIQIRIVGSVAPAAGAHPGAPSGAAAVAQALGRAVSWWEVAAAAATVVTAAGIFLLARARRGQEEAAVRG